MYYTVAQYTAKYFCVIQLIIQLVTVVTVYIMWVAVKSGLYTQ
jgi:hypothetical protein